MVKANNTLNPILRRIKSNLFHAGVGIYGHPRDFALAEAMMHQNLSNLWVIEKKSSTLSKNCGRGGENKI